MSLKKYLEGRKLTNSEVCKKAAIAESTLSQFLNNKRTIKLDTACKISDALEISLDQFRELTKEDGKVENL